MFTNTRIEIDVRAAFDRDPRIKHPELIALSVDEIGIVVLRGAVTNFPGCKALLAHYGIGPITSVTILAELGDPNRFSSSREAVRYAGLDITVHQSDQRPAPGRLSRQGPPALRRALFEAAQCARRRSSPDHAYYLETANRLGGNRACLSIARKLLKRSYHTLRELGEDALAPA